MKSFEAVEILNRNNMQELIDMLEEDAIDIFNAFLEDAPVQVAQLQELNADKEQLIIASHSLKSSAGYVGAERLSMYSAEIENHLNEDSIEEARKLFPHISEVLDESLHQINIALNELKD